MSTINTSPTDAFTVIIAGACAGLAVDSTLFPLDTVKTRLQTAQGFAKSGGFSKLYSGIGPVLAGSVPGGALFFLSYETAYNSGLLKDMSPSYKGAVAGPVAECVACTVRVPIELLKQRMQVARVPLQEVLQGVYIEGGRTASGAARVAYRGYAATATREVPFALVQMTLFETLTSQLGWSSLLAGCVAGSIGGVATTPMDVIKTRLMTKTYSPNELQRSSSALFLTVNEARSAWQQGGVRGLFRGGLTRSLWIGAGGGVFFGTFEFAKSALGGSNLS